MEKCEICDAYTPVKLIDLNMDTHGEPLYYYACFECSKLSVAEAVRVLNEKRN